MYTAKSIGDKIPYVAVVAVVGRRNVQQQHDIQISHTALKINRTYCSNDSNIT